MRPPVKISVFSLSALLVAMLMTTATPVSSDMGFFIDAEWLMEDCVQLTPAALSVEGITDEGNEIPLEVMTLLDVEGGSDIALLLEHPDEDLQAQGQALLDALVDDAYADLAVGEVSYEGVGIDLRYSGWDLLQPLDEDGTPRQPRVRNAQEIINLAKEQFGGTRPDGFDIVYVLTDLNIEMEPVGDAVAGMADCIGGVAFPEHAFAVGQWSLFDLPQEGLQVFGPVTFYKDAAAKIAAHEIGHLMGGHHHYQTCGDGLPAALANDELGPCTLMTNFVDFQTLPFSPINGVVVRGHAVEYVDHDDHDH